MSSGEVGRMLSEEKGSGEDGKREFEMKGEGRILDAGAYREKEMRWGTVWEEEGVGSGIGVKG